MRAGIAQACIALQRITASMWFGGVICHHGCNFSCEGCLIETQDALKLSPRKPIIHQLHWGKEIMVATNDELVIFPISQQCQEIPAHRTAEL